MRSGTLDVPGAVGLAVATALAVERRAVDRSRAWPRCATRWSTACSPPSPDVHLNGHPTQRLPGIANLTFPGCEGDALLMLLDARGVECSTGSACSAGVAQPSHVLTAMGADPRAARGSLRFSLGHDSTAADVAGRGRGDRARRSSGRAGPG